MKTISIVIPVYNEKEGLGHFHASLRKVIDGMEPGFEIVYVDDGSTDTSADVIRRLAHDDARIRPVYLSRNFGKEMATTAGLHAVTGDAAVIIDADGQHPVELIPSFIKKWQDGADVVVGVRTSNEREGIVKRYGSKFFYYLLRRLGVTGTVPGSTDYRIVDAAVIEEFKALKEHNRITRSLIDWLGYHKAVIHFSAKAREHGEASYSVRKLVQLALNGFVSLSFKPLYFAGYLGIVITTLSLLAGIFFVTEKYVLADPLSLNISGTAILADLVIFLVGIVLSCQGLLSIYIARIYTETQNRPIYVVKRSRE